MSNDVIQSGLQITAEWDDATKAEAMAFLNPAAFSLEELYARLGSDVQGAGAMGDEAIEAGRRVFTALSSKLKESICGNVELRAFADAVDADTGDALSLIGVVAALVKPEVGLTVNALLVAAIILRLGVRKLCA